MDSQKNENLLNLALDTPELEREKSLELNVGFDTIEKTWEVIVKYHGSLQELTRRGIIVEELIAGYAILTVPESEMDILTVTEQIEYVEKPKRLFFSDLAGNSASCYAPGGQLFGALTGRGVLVAMLDSGADYRHPEFRNPDGTTRIRALWDQTAEGTPPPGYHVGAEYTQEQLNESLMQEGAPPLSLDVSGHGTGVLAIAAGNNGVAYESEMVVVKLGTPKADSFPRTTELMMGINYVIEKALEYRMLVARHGGRLVGMITLRDKTHISLLFVEKSCHRKGIGRALIARMADYVRRTSGCRRLTVNASPYGTAFYHRIGFRDLESERRQNGIIFTPMEYIW